MKYAEIKERLELRDKETLPALSLRRCAYCGSEASKMGSAPGWWAYCLNEDCGTKVFAAVDTSYQNHDALHDAMYLVTARWNRLR